MLERLLNFFVLFFFVAVGSEFVEEEERIVVVGVGRWRREARGGTDEGVGPTVNDLWAGGRRWVGIVEGTRRRRWRNGEVGEIGGSHCKQSVWFLLLLLLFLIGCVRGNMQ